VAIKLNAHTLSTYNECSQNRNSKKTNFFQKHEKWESKRSILHDNQRQGQKKTFFTIDHPLPIQISFFNATVLFFLLRILGIIENRYLEHVCLGHKVFIH